MLSPTHMVSVTPSPRGLSHCPLTPPLWTALIQSPIVCECDAHSTHSSPGCTLSHTVSHSHIRSLSTTNSPPTWHRPPHGVTRRHIHVISLPSRAQSHIASRCNTLFPSYSLQQCTRAHSHTQPLCTHSLSVLHTIAPAGSHTQPSVLPCQSPAGHVGARAARRARAKALGPQIRRARKAPRRPVGVQTLENKRCRNVERGVSREKMKMDWDTEGEGGRWKERQARRKTQRQRNLERWRDLGTQGGGQAEDCRERQTQRQEGTRETPRPKCSLGDGEQEVRHPDRDRGGQRDGHSDRALRGTGAGAGPAEVRLRGVARRPQGRGWGGAWPGAWPGACPDHPSRLRRGGGRRRGAEAGAPGRGWGAGGRDGECLPQSAHPSSVFTTWSGKQDRRGGDHGPDPRCSHLVGGVGPWLPSSPPPLRRGSEEPGGGGEPGSHLESIRRAGRARAPGRCGRGAGS